MYWNTSGTPKRPVLVASSEKSAELKAAITAVQMAAIEYELTFTAEISAKCVIWAFQNIMDEFPWTTCYEQIKTVTELNPCGFHVLRPTDIRGWGIGSVIPKENRHLSRSAIQRACREIGIALTGAGHSPVIRFNTNLIPGQLAFWESNKEKTNYRALLYVIAQTLKASEAV